MYEDPRQQDFFIFVIKIQLTKCTDLERYVSFHRYVFMCYLHLYRQSIFRQGRKLFTKVSILLKKNLCKSTDLLVILYSD